MSEVSNLVHWAFRDASSTVVTIIVLWLIFAGTAWRRGD